MDYIIWAVDDFNSLALLRQLGQNDNASILFLIIGKKKYAFKSKYCKEYIETEGLDEGLAYLKANFKDKAHKPVIFTSGDNVMVYMENHKIELQDYFFIPGCSKDGDTEFFTDKYNMWRVAKNVGMYVPGCVLVTKNSQKELHKIKYPCLIKPAHETKGLYNEFKFRICTSEKKLLKTLKFVRETSTFVVQDLIKCSQQLLIYGCRTPQKETIICGSMLVDRFSETGSSSYGKIQNGTFGLIDKEIIKTFLDKIDYVGLFSFEFGVLDNKPYFFEINLRNDGTSNLFFQSGANAPLYLAHSFLDKDRSMVCINCKEGIAIDDLYDYENVIKKRITKKAWRDEFKAANYFKYFDRNDEEPYLLAKKGSKLQIKKDILLKKYRLLIVYFLTKFGLRK